MDLFILLRFSFRGLVSQSLLEEAGNMINYLCLFPVPSSLLKMLLNPTDRDFVILSLGFSFRALFSQSLCFSKRLNILNYCIT